MQDIIKYNQKDLVLNVNNNFDPKVLDLSAWEIFIETLIERREYQKQAIKNAIIYLASGRYNNLEELIDENYKENTELRKKYMTIEDYYKDLQLRGKLFANIDLATGTGKSYVIYGIAQIMLGLNIVDKVLVLCPSLTIESSLKEKFEYLSGNAELKKAIPSNAKYKNPRIIDANQTINNGDICIENIHAVYSNTSSSIEDSLKRGAERVLVLNDESHHIFNKISGNTKEDKNLKKWKEFLNSPKYNFKYILGFTGTAYNENQYFNDVIYRYSLRDAIDEGIVKKVEYVKEDDSKNDNEKFQKIYQNHITNKEKYPKVRPITIIICKDISSAKHLYSKLIEFLKEKEIMNKKAIEDKVLIVTSDKEHKKNIIELRNVDSKEDSKVEWIVSVSMLTEGWDVKNVFQIVPWEDKAFNSKLLISQVLGRGLRLPKEYSIPQPWVTVFNHESWSKNIRGLVEEVLELENRIVSQTIRDSKYNFSVYNINYKREEKEVEIKQKDIFDFSRLEREGIALESQIINVEKGTVFESVTGDQTRERNYMIENPTWTIDEILDKIYDEFEMRDWEGRVLKLGAQEYTQNNLPPRDKIKKIIERSMQKVGNTGDKVIDRNVNRILQAFSTLLRKKSKTIIPQIFDKEIIEVNTSKLESTSTSVSNLRRGTAIFVSSNWQKEIWDEKQQNIVQDVIDDEELPKYSSKIINEFLFKTPTNLVITHQEPERKFAEYLCKPEISEIIDSWIKSKDKGFYSIEYSMRYGGKDSKTRKYMHNNFNPDFFIKLTRDDMEYILIVEIKDDNDISKENKAKNKYAKEHFERLNEKLEKANIKQKYIFHFLSPNGYAEYFDFLKKGILLESQDKFRCRLEMALDEVEE